MTRGSSTKAARRRGYQVLTAVRVTTVGAFVLMVLYGIAALPVDGKLPGVVPAVGFTLCALVPAFAAAVYWRPAYRVPECVWLTSMSAVSLGLMGTAFGSYVATVLGGAALIALLARPRDGGTATRPAQWDDDPSMLDPLP